MVIVVYGVPIKWEIWPSSSPPSFQLPSPSPSSFPSPSPPPFHGRAKRKLHLTWSKLAPGIPRLKYTAATEAFCNVLINIQCGWWWVLIHRWLSIRRAYYVTYDQKDVDITKRVIATYGIDNKIIRKFGMCDIEANRLMFRTYSSYVYCCALWCSYQVIWSRMRISHNDIFTYLLRVRRCHSDVLTLLCRIKLTVLLQLRLSICTA